MSKFQEAQYNGGIAGKEREWALKSEFLALMSWMTLGKSVGLWACFLTRRVGTKFLLSRMKCGSNWKNECESILQIKSPVKCNYYYWAQHKFCNMPTTNGILVNISYTDIPHFTELHRCCVFYHLKARPSTRKRLRLALLQWFGKEPTVSPRTPVLSNYLKWLTFPVQECTIK